MNQLNKDTWSWALRTTWFLLKLFVRYPIWVTRAIIKGIRDGKKVKPRSEVGGS